MSGLMSPGAAALRDALRAKLAAGEQATPVYPPPLRRVTLMEVLRTI